VKRATKRLSLILAVVLAAMATVAPLTQLRSFREIFWWWSLGDHHPWLAWTIRGLSIYGLVVFAGVFVLLGSEGSGRKAGPVEEDEATSRSKASNELSWWWIGGLIALAIPAFVVLAVFCTILAPFLGLFGVYLAYCALADAMRPRVQAPQPEQPLPEISIQPGQRAAWAKWAHVSYSDREFTVDDGREDANGDEAGSGEAPAG
jgi:hypothetical protein